MSSPTAAVATSYLHADEPTRTHRHGWWWKSLLAGALLWLVTIVVTIATRNANLVPTLILLGSFLVPFSVVLFAAERISTAFPVTSLMLAFFVGGVLGVLGASVLEAPLASGGLGGFLLVGLIEELVKGVLVVVIGRHLVPKTARQGALLGATVGAGFAAFESAGYAFNAALGRGGIDLLGLLQTEAVRSVLTPLGHVLWTAVLGAALFAASRDGRRYRFAVGVVLAYLLVAVLHGLWDAMGGISTIIAIVATGNAVPAFEYDTLRPGTQGEVGGISNGVYVLGLGVVSVLGGLTLRGIVRHHRPRDRAMSEQHAA
ncbi:PrsW family intramembrane metalloprotease [Amnibacterium kyonggiense]|uniref:RsiW-degrading membrane proteinase PrsW (M82 family) n=1 Tax=Amnibacterium kyonggiense TaxID=595671 RepID=A0A4R7FHI0_9MICO|nr:PrsW family glutamic-type intramembrane protease [Amnibacterium kyonggiense]TDS75654.1 RsiW-degrading membrane proteinase PrsW (M82 family) [Amnibacterium kyonggiense]